MPWHVPTTMCAFLKLVTLHQGAALQPGSFATPSCFFAEKLVSEGDEFVGEEVAGGFFADDGVPEHRGDAVAGTLDGDVFFGVDVALADGACCEDAFACDV